MTKIWTGCNPRKEVVTASAIATREMTRADTLKTVSSKVYSSALPTIRDNILNVFFISLCIDNIVPASFTIQQTEFFLSIILSDLLDYEWIFQHFLAAVFHYEYGIFVPETYDFFRTGTLHGADEHLMLLIHRIGINPETA